MSDRINPAETPAVFEQLGILPMAGGWARRANGLCYGCLLGVIASRRIGFDAVYSIAGPEAHENCHRAQDLASRTGLDESYALGLDDGWEGNRHYKPRSEGPRHDRWKEGYQDGRAARAACEASDMDIKRDGYLAARFA